MVELNIELYSHHFVVRRHSPRGREVCERFAMRNVQYTLQRQGQRFVQVPFKVYAAVNALKTEFRFHINQYAEFREYLRNIAVIEDNMISVLTVPIPKGPSVPLKIKAGWSARGEQPQAIEYVTGTVPPRSKLLALQTGQGKSATALMSQEKLQVRTVYIMKPSYIEKWVADSHKTLDLKEDEVVTVAGAGQLMALIAQASEGPLPEKVILISNRTFQLWIKLYEQVGDAILEQGWDCTPQNFLTHLQAEMRTIDEVHQDFHFNFKLDLYTHVERTLALSATLISDDPFMQHVYKIAYPMGERYVSQVGYKKYIATRAIFFSLKRPDLIRYLDPAKRYSHIRFESSIAKYKDTLKAYLELINSCLIEYYFKDKKPGDKAIVFCASIEFCSIVTNALQKLHPSLNVKRYCEQDPYQENCLDPDIRVTTLLSAGTAVDIPGLTTTVLTVGVKSSQGNVQGLGRLRELADGRTPIFVWFVCENIQKHIEYHENKVRLLEDKTKSYKPEHTGIVV